MKRLLTRVILVGIAMMLMVGVRNAGADTPPGTYSYTVSDDTYGDIGTYTNVVHRDGDLVTVTTKIRIAVKMFFMTVHRMSMDTVSVWRDGRVIEFERVNDNNGEKSRVTGRAVGDKFLIDGRNGKYIAPANVWPANPWDIEITRRDTFMAPNSGEVYPASALPPQKQKIKVDGRLVDTRYFRFTGKYQEELWVDHRNVPVRFAMMLKQGPITLTLKRSERYGEVAAEPREDDPSQYLD